MRGGLGVADLAALRKAVLDTIPKGTEELKRQLATQMSKDFLNYEVLHSCKPTQRYG